MITYFTLFFFFSFFLFFCFSFFLLLLESKRIFFFNFIISNFPSFSSEDGGWTEWGEWGDCSRTCGGGMRRSNRTFTNPSPNFFSKLEVYHDTIHYKDERCNTFDCPCEYKCNCPTDSLLHCDITSYHHGINTGIVYTILI